jgi:hypothetical protein
MSVPIPYIDAGGNSRTIAAEQIGSNIAFDSVPNTNGAPVATGNPMPVSDAALGTPSDAAWSSGVGSVIALLKKIAGGLSLSPTNVAATVTNPTVTTGGTTLVTAGAAKVWLDIQNTSGSANMTLMAGALILRVLTPYATYTREGSAIPANAITAISSVGTITAAVSII